MARPLKIATAAYPLDRFDSWAGYENKLSTWVAEATEQGARLLVFPEYGAMELASLGGEAVCADLMVASRFVSDRMEEVKALHRTLSARHGVHIVGASGPVFLPDGLLVNRAHLHSPSGRTGFQDKQMMTLWEKDPWGVSGAAGGAGPLRLFETEIGRLAISICYDSQFPLIARAQTGADLFIVPSCTEALEGYWRVRIGSMARALENQCIAVMSSLVGEFPLIEAVETNTGAGGVFGPPDVGFPATGVIAEGRIGVPGWTFAEIDLNDITFIRARGHVRNRDDWMDQPVGTTPELCDLR